MQQARTKVAAQAQAILELRRRGVTPPTIHDPSELVEFSGNPKGFFKEVLGVNGEKYHDQVDRIIDAVMTHDRVLIPSGNNLGKTFTLAGVVCWVMGSLAQEKNELGRPRGAKVQLLGTDHDAIFYTTYTQMIVHVQSAALRGWNFPGDISLKSVHWHVRPDWSVEPMSPPRSIQASVAHAASGRHHENLWIIIEEGPGVVESTWASCEGMASGRGNKIISPLNPTEQSGPAWERHRRSGWHTLSLSALDHPNVVERRDVIPGGAISHENVDARVKGECEDMGPFPEVVPNEDHGEFVYSLTGDPRDKRVYRPNPRFRAQVLGQWAQGSSEGPLFTPRTWDNAVDRWESMTQPNSDPDRVGIDLARLGADEIQAAPSWGESGPSILRGYRLVMENQDEVEEEEFRRDNLLYLGRLVRIPNGEGREVAERIHSQFPTSSILLDSSTVGASPYDHLRYVLNRENVEGLMSSSKAPEPEVDEPRFENLRAAMYWRFSRLVRYGLAAVPPDGKLREEAMATGVLYSARVVNGKKVDVVRIEAKEAIKRRIGRSPDSLDSVVMSAWEERSRTRAWILTGGDDD